jgi:hypothetical protein
MPAVSRTAKDVLDWDPLARWKLYKKSENSYSCKCVHPRHTGHSTKTYCTRQLTLPGGDSQLMLRYLKHWALSGLAAKISARAPNPVYFGRRRPSSFVVRPSVSSVRLVRPSPSSVVVVLCPPRPSRPSRLPRPPRPPCLFSSPPANPRPRANFLNKSNGTRCNGKRICLTGWLEIAVRVKTWASWPKHFCFRNWSQM